MTTFSHKYLLYVAKMLCKFFKAKMQNFQLYYDTKYSLFLRNFRENLEIFYEFFVYAEIKKHFRPNSNFNAKRL